MESEKQTYQHIHSHEYHGSKQQDTPAHTDWLGSDKEFPRLTTEMTGSNITENRWEIIDKGKAAKDDVRSQSDWSEINDFEAHSFAEIATKSRNLKETGRVRKPIKPHRPVSHKSNKKIKDDDKHQEENEIVDDGDISGVYYTHKSSALSQFKVASRIKQVDPLQYTSVRIKNCPVCSNK